MENIIISNPNEFEKIKRKIIEQGFEKLHIIADFDRTLTHAYLKNSNEPVSSVISILRDENYLIQGYSAKARTLFEHYHPIEINKSIPIEEKKKAMDQWWTKHSNLLIESGLNKSDLKKVAKSKRINFREKTFEIFQLLNKKNVPVVILSASGLGDESLIYTLEYHKLYFPNVKVISNKYLWDENSNAIKFVTPHIHTFNKNETSIKNSPIYFKIKNRKNVILLGDSLGDVLMVEGFNYENLLKIGFLNSNVKEDLQEYKKHYDIIITNDAPMDFIYELLKEMKLNLK